MSRFSLTTCPIDGLMLIDRGQIGDSRGFLSRVFCSDELSAAGWHKPIAQINHTRTERRGTLRGMHFQTPPHAELKLVSCIRGEVWDVAVDLRTNSPTFLHWHAEHLSAENRRAFLIPEGFAHGFQVLSDGAELLYCHSEPYTPQAEAGVHPQDPKLGISWPLPIAEISERDNQRPALTPSFTGVRL
ncbi:dTDP-4-dehydrorhamnose 3,5-epimerase [Agrobacterium tumefaciens]|uniref:dTDP-4-dehydrorhamnose 3,5-epimerase n=1 Tax=Agrobacterium tumefaciens TaxID=358 RepID=UPI00287E808C|nr:dTDP-4-dehydrorhamnose 3,5-epimerase [Agrobacterium tumefaciens]MDS7594761.1 dTDP-4-dehydrorhamnose 3,5-epimerase [Agrobacterium tumefaciens]